MDYCVENVKVTIGGEEYSIKSDVDIETTRKIAEYVDGKLQEVKKSNPMRDNYKLAILSALNIAGELYDFKQKYQEKCQHLELLEHKASQIVTKIDDTMLQ